MDTLLFYLAAINLVLAIITCLNLCLGDRKIRKLIQVESALTGKLSFPKVSIIAAARNEQSNIAEAVNSLIMQDYPDFEVIIANDRSTDNTANILESISKTNFLLKILNITKLPEGWLGKNHALYLAAQHASGQYLLFTDADVVMAPDTIKKTVAYAVANNLDHLAVVPEPVMPTWFLKTLVIVFITYFNSIVRPWKAADSKSRAFIGIGAFNLVKSDVYRSVGTHKTIAMRPDDDMKLGKIIKSNNFRQEMLNGIGLISVQWYSSVSGLINGLTKNFFAGVNYSIIIVIITSVMMLFFNFLPFIAVFFTSSFTQLMYFTTVILFFLTVFSSTKYLDINRLFVLAAPLAILVYVYIMWRSMLFALKNNGINWRNTHYKLSELKANRV